MEYITVFVLEVLFCLAVSSIVLLRLQRLLRRIGNEVCERGGGATEFWVAYTQLMMVVAPLLLVSWQSRAGYHPVPVEQLKSSLTLVLTGQFIGLVLVGRAVWKTIVRETPAAPAAPAPAAILKAEAA